MVKKPYWGNLPMPPNRSKYHFVFTISLFGFIFLSIPFLTLQADELPRKEAVTYFSGKITLAATLLIPAGPGPFPGVVIIHGSGSSTRSNPWTSAYASAFVERGIAVLHPDKRGAGESGGNWREATFTDLADDAISGLHFLASNHKIDTSRIGLIGFSQGGHVVPVAATRSSAVRFVINVSGSVVPMMEQIRDEIRLMAEREGLTDDELATVQSINEKGIHYALTGEDWTGYAEALMEAKKGRLSGTDVIEGFPTEQESPTWQFVDVIGDFDPLPYWRKVDVPTLFLYGGRDENVDVYKSVDIIEESLTHTGLPYSLLLFRNNGHGLFRDDAMDFIARYIHDDGID
jgi:dipeptidyl aminopeptidase/acylaminoacyl peptidase